MFEIIVYFVVPVLLILIAAYFYVEIKRKKAEEAAKKARTVRVATIKHNFKADLIRLVEHEILTIREQEAVFRIANNFFVFQPVTNNSIDYLEKLLTSIINSLPSSGPDSINFDLVQEYVRLFISALPTDAGGYLGRFYRTELPKLITQLVASQEKVHSTSTTIEIGLKKAKPSATDSSNEEPQPIVNEDSKEESQPIAHESIQK